MKNNVSNLLHSQTTNYNLPTTIVNFLNSLQYNCSDYESSTTRNNTDSEDDFGKVIGVWFNGCICIIGSIGNLVSFIALTNTYKTHSSNLVYALKWLSITDSMFLTVAFIMLTLVNVEWFETLAESRDAIQKYVWPVLLMLQMMSVWLTVLISWERYIAICKPLQINSVCTRSRMRKMIICVLLSCIVFNVPRFLEYTEKMEKSKVGENYYYRILYSGLLYACILFLAPLTLLFYLNVNLVLVLKANRRNWEEFKKTQQRREQSLTKVPLTIVFIFFFCGTPSVLINIADSVDPEIYSVACLVLANSLLLINSASNFIIYCMLGKKFRGEFLKLLYCRCRSTKSQAIYRFASEYKTDLK